MINGMNPVGISVANLVRSIEFYRDLLGMESFTSRLEHHLVPATAIPIGVFAADEGLIPLHFPA